MTFTGASALVPSVRLALFVPCYVDQLRPSVGLAAVELLERAGVEVEVPSQAACCGQPLINMGSRPAAQPLLRCFERAFADYDRVVCPSGSCVSTLRGAGLADGLGQRVEEFTSFFADLEADIEFAPRPGRVALHASCHTLRELGAGTPSEQPCAAVRRDPARELLGRVPQLELVVAGRRDECCGFGGTFAVTEAAVSRRMGQDRVRAFIAAGADVVTGTDISCLLQLEGEARRLGHEAKFPHVAELLADCAREAR